jgi:hypothetical protein
VGLLDFKGILYFFFIEFENTQLWI